MKYYGKEKCRILKEIRAEIARQNDIEWVVSECKHKGNCKGTCPKCEQEVRDLEAALARRAALGKTVAVAGISAAISLSVTGCVNPFSQPTGGEPMAPMPGDVYVPTETAVSDGEMLPPESDTYVLMGDVYVPPETDTDEETEIEETSEETSEEASETEDPAMVKGEAP